MKKLVTILPSPPMHWVGDGLPVRSIFSYDGWGRELSPFLLLDYAAPAEFQPTNARRGVGEHPHRGFETVTILYQGELEHRDSSGGGGVIGAGDVQWMTAASGLVHEEFHSADFARNGGTLEMVQLWVNLRSSDKGAPPRYQTLLNHGIPRVHLPDKGGIVRIIAGEYEGVQGPAKTFSPINLWDIRMNCGAKAEIKLPEGYTTAILVLHGKLSFKEENVAAEGELAVFSREGASVSIESVNETTLLLLNAEAIDEPVVGYGPFVMNSREEILQAIDDFNAGRMGTLRGGSAE